MYSHIRQPQTDTNTIKFGNYIAIEMNAKKNPDANSYQVKHPKDPILLEVLNSESPYLAGAEERNDMSTDWPGISKVVFYFKRVQVEGNWEWKFSEYVILP